MTTSFQQALEAHDLAALRACAKSDLHNHAVLGGNRAFLEAWANRELQPLDRTLGSMEDMHEWVGANLGGLLSTLEGRLKAIEAAFVQARLDGVTRLEIGDDVWAITLFDGSAERMTDALRTLHKMAAPDIEWIPQLGISRHCTVDAITAWMEPHLGLGFYKTLDLAGDEHAQPIERFKGVYRHAKAAGLVLKAHAGEWGDAASVQRAVEELELDEVQHGIAAADSPAVMRFLADNQIRLNICPTSNVMLGRVDSLAHHPVRKLFDAGVKVTINTDDALVFGKSVSEEFLALYEAGLFTPAELDEIRLNGLRDS